MEPRREAGPAWSGDNRVELLPYGAALFPAMREAWREARRSIWLETYIFGDDATARELAADLVDAARRGVQVRVLVDGFGSAEALPALTAIFDASAVDFMVYRPWRHWLEAVQRGHWRRLHRKLCVVDGRVAFVGGINLIDDRFDLNHGWSAQPRLDYAVRVRGPVSRQIAWSMRRLWLRTVATGSVQRRLTRAPGPNLLGSPAARRRYLDELVAHGRRPAPRGGRGVAEVGMRAALVVRDNLFQRRAIEHAYIAAIDRARDTVLLACPYFYPGRGFREALIRAAGRGVAVTLLLQGRADYRIAAWAARALYRELSAAGVRIVEYTRAYLHGKVAVVDGVWATVGSSNIDPLSLLVNREANVVVRDRRFAQALADHLSAEIATAQPVDLRRRRLPWWASPLVGVAARLLIALVGGGRRY